MSEIIKTENLRYSYSCDNGDNKFALDGVDLSINRGEFVAILGHNGSGKSTLAKHFNAINLPTSGKVYIDGMDTTDESKTYDIRKNIGMVFQNPDNQIIATVVEEDVAFALENMGVEPIEIRRRVDDSLKAVDMYGFRTHAPHLLSGGQKQRVAIAGIIAMSPSCIVLDEPTAMLDPSGREEVMSVIKRLNQELGTTIVLITHHMEEACRAQRVIVMNKGKILLDGIPKDIFTDINTLSNVGLAVPQTVEVLNEINKTGENLDIGALTVEECADVLEKYLEG